MSVGILIAQYKIQLCTIMQQVLFAFVCMLRNSLNRFINKIKLENRFYYNNCYNYNLMLNNIMKLVIVQA